MAALDEAWRAVEGQQEQVRSRIAGLRSQAASLRASYAELVLAQKDHERVKNLVNSQTATREELDQKQAALESAREKYKVAEQSVQQARALLALAPDYQHPEQVPADLERTDTQVRRAVAAGQQILANLGLASGLHALEPEALHAALIRLTEQHLRVVVRRGAGGAVGSDPGRPDGRDAGRPVVRPRPAVRASQRGQGPEEPRRGRAEAQLRRDPGAGLRLRQPAVGQPGRLCPGRAGLAVDPAAWTRSTSRRISRRRNWPSSTIGQPVAISVDAYPGRVVRGRVSGFAPATGAASSMLPPENATGNFVKVVQRVPVRIDLVEPNPREAPLLVGMSVEPEVDIKAPPSGPDAGSRLRSGTTSQSSSQEAHP